MGSEKTSRWFDTFDIMGTRSRIRQSQRVAKAQRKEILKQKQIESLKVAEETDEIKRRQYLSRYGGRKSLMSGSVPSQGSMTDQLGG